jgi:ketosteroid isomerase-like protein
MQPAVRKMMSKGKLMRYFAVVLLMSVSATMASVGACAAVDGQTEAVSQALENHHANLKSQDVEKIMASFSDDYLSGPGMDKAGLRTYYEDLVSRSTFEFMEIGVADSKISIEGDSATVQPVVYYTLVSTAAYVVRMKNETDGVWRIVSTDIVN